MRAPLKHRLNTFLENEIQQPSFWKRTIACVQWLRSFSLWFKILFRNIELWSKEYLGWIVTIVVWTNYINQHWTNYLLRLKQTLLVSASPKLLQKKRDLPRVHRSKTHPLQPGLQGHPHANIKLIKNHLTEERNEAISSAWRFVETYHVGHHAQITHMIDWNPAQMPNKCLVFSG